jgi:nucleotide-binding universal stress UspA family protein
MRILVPVDGSLPANRAVAHAIALVHDRDGGGIILLNVQGPETLEVSDISAVMSVEPDRRSVARQSRKALHKAVGLCRKAQVQFETRVEMGPVAETIAKLARDLRADQIVMGSRGLGALRRLILGSVATKLVPLVRVPVTLVK